MKLNFNTPFQGVTKLEELARLLGIRKSDIVNFLACEGYLNLDKNPNRKSQKWFVESKNSQEFEMTPKGSQRVQKLILDAGLKKVKSIWPFEE